MTMMGLYNDIELQYDFGRKDHVQYLTVSKSYSDGCTCSVFALILDVSVNCFFSYVGTGLLGLNQY